MKGKRDTVPERLLEIILNLVVTGSEKWLSYQGESGLILLVGLIPGFDSLPSPALLPLSKKTGDPRVLCWRFKCANLVQCTPPPVAKPQKPHSTHNSLYFPERFTTAYGHSCVPNLAVLDLKPFV